MDNHGNNAQEVHEAQQPWMRRGRECMAFAMCGHQRIHCIYQQHPHPAGMIVVGESLLHIARSMVYNNTTITMPDGAIVTQEQLLQEVHQIAELQNFHTLRLGLCYIRLGIAAMRYTCHFMARPQDAEFVNSHYFSTHWAERYFAYHAEFHQKLGHLHHSFLTDGSTLESAAQEYHRWCDAILRLNRIVHPARKDVEHWQYLNYVRLHCTDMFPRHIYMLVAPPLNPPVPKDPSFKHIVFPGG